MPSSKAFVVWCLIFLLLMPCYSLSHMQAEAVKRIPAVGAEIQRLSEHKHLSRSAHARIMQDRCSMTWLDLTHGLAKTGCVVIFNQDASHNFDIGNCIAQSSRAWDMELLKMTYNSLDLYSIDVKKTLVHLLNKIAQQSTNNLWRIID